MKDKLIMSPGPTEVHEEVRRAMALPVNLPDGHPDFTSFYLRLTDELKKIYDTENDVRILNGEGILGLEAAMNSLLKTGDEVLCIENGIFGKAFGQLAEDSGAKVSFFSSSSKKPIDLTALEEHLKANSSFKIATMVHCETPTGVLNNIEKISGLLKKYGILTVVDAVSTFGGEKLRTDLWSLDIVIAASQKCLSASSGLVFLSISQEAWEMIEDNRKNIQGLYTNLLLWKNIETTGVIPYTQPIAQLYGLEKAMVRWNQENSIARHHILANAVKQAVVSSGLNLYPDTGFSNTVTAVLMPTGITYTRLRNELWEEHNVFVATSPGQFSGKIFRIGHMGENCREEKLYHLLKAVNKVFSHHGVALKVDLHKAFVNALNR